MKRSLEEEDFHQSMVKNEGNLYTLVYIDTNMTTRSDTMGIKEEIFEEFFKNQKKTQDFLTFG